MVSVSKQKIRAFYARIFLQFIKALKQPRFKLPYFVQEQFCSSQVSKESNLLAAKKEVCQSSSGNASRNSLLRRNAAPSSLNSSYSRLSSVKVPSGFRVTKTGAK